MAKLASYAALVRQTGSRVDAGKQGEHFLRRCERMVKRKVAPQLVAILWDAMADLNPEPLEQFAAILRGLREHNQQVEQGDSRHALPFLAKASRIADVAKLQGKPLTGRELLQQMGVTKEHDDSSRERKALKFIRAYLAPEKRGRPMKKGTRNRET
jgi:hypothetical protein